LNPHLYSKSRDFYSQKNKTRTFIPKNPYFMRLT